MRIKPKTFFKNKQHQKDFLKNGFTIIPFANEEQIKYLKDIYTSSVKDSDAELYATHNANTYEVNCQVSKAIGETAKDFLNKSFCNIKYFLGHFMVKQKGYNYEMPLHQDWSVVDEKKHFSTNIWFALHDVKIEHGALFAIPGSHLFYHNRRSGSLDLPRVPYDDILDNLITPVELKAGEAFVYTQALFHGSFPNISDQDRLAIVFTIIQDDIDMEYFHTNDQLTKSKEIDEYQLSSDIILKQLHLLEKGFPPKNISAINRIKYRPVNFDKIDSKDLEIKTRFISKMFNPRVWDALVKRIALSI